jgi:hypothetical protein
MVETASKKKLFAFIRMKDKGCVSVAQGKHKLVFRRMTTAGKKI